MNTYIYTYIWLYVYVYIWIFFFREYVSIYHSWKLSVFVQVCLNDAFKTAVTSLARPGVLSAEDKALLRLKWDNNTQKKPNATQEVSSCACVCPSICLFDVFPLALSTWRLDFVSLVGQMCYWLDRKVLARSWGTLSPCHCQIIARRIHVRVLCTIHHILDWCICSEHQSCVVMRVTLYWASYCNHNSAQDRHGYIARLCGVAVCVVQCFALCPSRQGDVPHV